jgi:hypothetical protein
MESGFVANYRDNILENVGGLYLNESSIKDCFQAKSPKLNLLKKYRKNISCEDLTSLVKK